MDSQVQVAMRVRPLMSHELIDNCKFAITYPAAGEVCVGGDNRFTFDAVFDEKTTQEKVYTDMVAPLVDNFVRGYNATILAYGQTGSGKTHTMGTACSEVVDISDQQEGILPRALSFLCGLSTRFPETQFAFKVSFLEIHNDNIRDLLSSPDSTTSIDRPPSSARLRDDVINIRESADGKIFITGMSEHSASSLADMLGLLRRGSLSRTTGSTAMNVHSSRSHAIFTVQLEQRKCTARDLDSSADADSEAFKSSSSDTSLSSSIDLSSPIPRGEDEDVETLVSKFHFVDLAGSERLKRTGAVGKRMQESIHINSGLLALGNVINALSDPKRKGGHVPFRDSKITRLLQDSLGGNSKTLMMACISPADTNVEESVNTLRYASRARHIQNKAVINVDPHVAKLQRLQSRVAELETALALQGGCLPTAAATSTKIDSDALQLLRDKARLYEAEMARLEARLVATTDELTRVSGLLLAALAKGDSARVLADAQGDAAVSAQQLPLVEELRREVQTLYLRLRQQEKQSLVMVGLTGDALDLTQAQAKVETADCEGEPEDAPSENVSEEAAHLARLSEMKDKEHQLQMRELARVQSQLDAEIQRKEQQRRGLSVRSAEELQAVCANFNEKIGELKARATKAEQERDRLLKDLAEASADTKRTGDKARTQAKIAELNAKLDDYRASIAENKRLRAELTAEQQRYTRLEADISSAQKQKVQLKLKMEEQAQVHRAWVQMQSQKLNALQREDSKQKLLMAKVQTQLEKQGAVLKRTQEERALLQGQLLRQEAKQQNAREIRAAGAASAALRREAKQAPAAASTLLRAKSGPPGPAPHPSAPLSVANASGLSRLTGPTSSSLAKAVTDKKEKPFVARSATAAKPEFSMAKKPEVSGPTRRPLGSVAENNTNTVVNGPAVVGVPAGGSENLPEDTLNTNKRRLSSDNGVNNKKPKLDPAAGATTKAKLDTTNAKYVEQKKQEATKKALKDRVTQVKKALLQKLNEGDEAVLRTVASIGKKRAQQILEYRAEFHRTHNLAIAPFQNVEDLKDAGIPESAIEKILKENVASSLEQLIGDLV